MEAPLQRKIQLRSDRMSRPSPPASVRPPPSAARAGASSANCRRSCRVDSCAPRFPGLANPGPEQQQCPRRRESRTDERPMHLLTIETEITAGMLRSFSMSFSERVLFRHHRTTIPRCGVVVVCPGVDHEVPRVVMRLEIWRLRVGAEGKLEDRHPRNTNPPRNASTSGVITPRFSATKGNWSMPSGLHHLKSREAGPLTYCHASPWSRRAGFPMTPQTRGSDRCEPDQPDREGERHRSIHQA